MGTVLERDQCVQEPRGRADALDTEGSSWEGSIIFTQVAERLGGLPLFKDVVLSRTAKFDNPSYVKTGDLLQAWVKDGAFNSDFSSESDPYAETLFESGKAAMWDIGDWDVATLWPLMHSNLGWSRSPRSRGVRATARKWATSSIPTPLYR